MRGEDQWSGGCTAICGVVAVVLALWCLEAGAQVSPARGSTPAAKMDESGGPETAGFSRAPIRLTPSQRQLIGLRYASAERQPLDLTIRTVGRIEADERKLADVTLKIGGYINELFVDFTGKQVRKGDPLFKLYSPDLVSAEQEYLLAVQTTERLKGSSVSGAAESADSLLRASQQRLRLWDLTDRQIREIRASGKPNLNQTIYSPVSGVVLEKMVFKGQRVEAGTMLYRIADLSTVWISADVYEYEAPFVKVGQQARISLSSYPDVAFAAKVSYVYPTLDPKTRTVRVRFELPNSDAEHPLRPEMYGNVELKRPLGERLVVPRSAVLDSGREQVVFLDGGNGQLSPRNVKIGVRAGDRVEILEGLNAGDRVVASANFLVDSESKLQGAESMMGMMGSIGMGDWKMESARPMDMAGESSPSAPDARKSPASAPTVAAGPDEKRVGDFVVAVSLAEESPGVGKRAVRVRVKDASGNPVTGATVRFNYTMDMPGMAIAESAAKEVGGGVYQGMADFTMAGPWGVVVEVGVPGKAPARGKFTVRVNG